jgi:tRNA A-37 threonylcarbamoyl transferase component Bud32
MANQIIKLTVGGAVQAQAGTYLPRPADEQLLNVCRAGSFAYVLACRQIGKSSLMIATSDKLNQAGVRTAQIDLNSIGQRTDAESWYFSFIDELADRLKLKIDVQVWWDTRPRLSTFTQRFLQFLREVILEEITENVVIFVDEIDMTLVLDFTDDFFAAIRSVYNERAQHPAYRRLAFVLLGVATPDELIKDQARTPFNIGQPITLRDFTLDECDPFRAELENSFHAQGRAYFKRVYEWTAGHPYLTQKLCAAILQEDAPVLEAGDSGLVDRLVHKLFLAPKARSEDNIQFVQTRVTGDPYAPEMLKVYKRVLEGEKPVHDDEQSPPINRLKLYGLVVAQDGKLVLRNRLYERAFDLLWTKEMLRLASTSLRLGLPSERYQVLQQIGQGGFATVYLAQRKDAEKTEAVALKVLKPDSISDRNQVERFKQEALAISRLEHPNIIRILETGGDEETLYITMEYVPGGTLCDRLKSGTLSRDEAVHIIRHIGDALALAHKSGIVHRDIKPANILLDTSQDPVRPVLTDFGLVKVLTGDDFKKIQSTTIMGTLDYMAPEQWRQETPTPATDIYALALTFFEMLAGQRPFAREASYYDLMNKHLKEPLPRLSGVATEVGPFFDQVLLQAAAKEPSERFASMADFIAAIETANQLAEDAERIEQEIQAAKMVEVARDYIQRGRYDPDKALSMIEIALEMCSGYIDALRLRAGIRLEQEQYEAALDDYQQAYKQVGDPTSEIGVEYLGALSQVADTYWQGQMYPEAVAYYEQIRTILDGKDHEESSLRAIWGRVQERLVEYHHLEGDTAYAAGEPKDIDQAIRSLDQRIEALVALGADNESQLLADKLKLLRVKKYEDVIVDAQAAIDQIHARPSVATSCDEGFFQHYMAIDEAYQGLAELEPENKEWREKRRQKLMERVEVRQACATKALERPEPDYEVALRHYRAIQDIEETKYPGIAQQLSLNLDERIAELEAKADFDGKYNEIMKLRDSGDYLKALERLDQEFIRTGNYEHRQAARWLWGLVYAKCHDGNYPPEFESLSSFDVLSQRLVRLERTRIQGLRGRLEPWSQPRILETIRDENQALKGYEEQVTGIEALISEAVTHGFAERPEVEMCRSDLAGVKARIEQQRRTFLEKDMNELARKIDAWLHEIEEIEALLQTGNPLKDIPLFLDRSDDTQRAIEADLAFEMLGALESASAEIQRTIEQVELRIQGRLCRVLVEDVGRRDEALARAREESDRLQAELAEAAEESAALRQQEDSLKQQSKTYRQQYEINRFVIPISVILALIAGGLIAERVKLLPAQSIIRLIALGLLIAYFAYYVWAYFFSKTGNE